MSKLGRFIPLAICAAAITFLLPALASAQGNYDPDRDHDRDRDRDGRYNREALRHTTERLKDLSKDFEKRLDDSFDRTGYEDTSVEHRVLDLAKEFHNATKELDDRVDDNRDLDQSRDQARRVLRLGSAISRLMEHNRFEHKAEADWSQLRGNLRYVARAYRLEEDGDED
jgi:hypothetical protein